MKNKKAFISVFFLAAFCSVLFMFCNDPDGDDGFNEESPESRAQLGKTLAERHCQSCHLFPDPSLLDKQNWQIALELMGPRLGIYAHNGRRYKIYTDIDQDNYPDRPAMNSWDWQNIIEYYTAMSPAALPAQEKPKAISRQMPFSVKLPPELFVEPENLAPLVKIDTSVRPARIWINKTGSTNTLFLLDGQMNIIDSLNNSGPIVNLEPDAGEWTACKIGADLLGNNAKNGALIRLKVANQKIRAASKPLIDSLARPIHITYADLNGDQRKDYLVAEFGNMFGSLIWMENQGGGKYKRRDIRSLPGASKTIVRDDNGDGQPDIWALFGQGEEGIFLYTNQGNGAFAEKQVLRVPASYGSTSFELHDFNQDGFTDILYTCGDRGDGIPQLKPYHGVYVYVNNGKNEFSKAYFFPINGCVKAMAEDFDGDGDLDIAAIGFFTDSQQPSEGFTYLENKGSLDFQPYALAPETGFKRALSMDIGDINGDGKPDIVLGQGSMGNKASGDKLPLCIALINEF
ncbi:MAG TPA: FG-GAP-like repeat-containing protein [Flavitalea sp.]|nr:FG-GAP-like repeat-containing protein [Flavitalea sp.]